MLLDELIVFFKSLDIEDRYDYLMPIERKGMALVQALLEKVSKQDLRLSKTQIISNNVLRYVPSAFFANKRILTFDDTSYHGHMQAKVKKILEKEHNAKVKTASFLVHESCSASNEPDYYFRRHIGFDQYWELRNELLDFLGESVRVLLDTEHISICILTNLSTEDEIEILKNLGDLLYIPLTKKSIDNKFLFTVHRPHFFELKRIALPPKTRTDLIVCKIRLKVADGQIWIVPIVYPGVPIKFDTGSCPIRNQKCAFCKSLRQNPDPEECFYCVATYVGGEMLRATLSALKHFLDSSAQIEMGPVDNLTMLFPFLEASSLKQWVGEIIEEKSDERGLSISRGSIIPLPQDLSSFIMPVLREIVRYRDDYEIRKSSGEIAEDDSEGAIPVETLFKQLHTTTREREISRCCDILIDQGVICPTQLPTSNGVALISRAFRLDGELIYEYAREAVYEWEIGLEL